jgi:dUTP pyrophosphatase
MTEDRITYATAGSAGADIKSSENVTIQPGEWVAVRTDVVLELPTGIEVQVRPRSGLALNHGITVLNAPGTIDSDYRGEIKVILINHSKVPYHISEGDRIAQLVFASYVRADITKKDPADTDFVVQQGGERGAGGFGSTGK